MIRTAHKQWTTDRPLITEEPQDDQATVQECVNEALEGLLEALRVTRDRDTSILLIEAITAIKKLHSIQGG